MKFLASFALYLIFCLTIQSQEIVNLPFDKASNVVWAGPEKAYLSKDWQTEVITNVSSPTLMIYKPDNSINTGTTVIIAPGGGLFALSIENEGVAVANWLNKKGITAVILKYRLIPTKEDGVAEMAKIDRKDPARFEGMVHNVLPYSVNDGLEAIKYLRIHAKALDIDPSKIGFMGFSAGGAVTMGVAYSYEKESRPDFLVPVYTWTRVFNVEKPKTDAPPMLLICATDDPLELASGSIELYNSWNRENLNVSLHMYGKGGHGFGMKKSGLPSEHWIDRCYEWMISEGFTKPLEN